MPREMICKLHSPTPITLACRHLASGVECGFHTAERGERPDACCDRCAEKRASVGEWTAELDRQADLALTCTYCYDLAAAHNRNVPPHARGKHSTMTNPEFRALCEHATAQVADVQERARTKWSFDVYERIGESGLPIPRQHARVTCGD